MALVVIIHIAVMARADALVSQHHTGCNVQSTPTASKEGEAQVHSKMLKAWSLHNSLAESHKMCPTVGWTWMPSILGTAMKLRHTNLPCPLYEQR